MGRFVNKEDDEADDPIQVVDGNITMVTTTGMTLHFKLEGRCMAIDAQSHMKPSVAMVSYILFQSILMSSLNDIKCQVSCLLAIHVEVGAETVLPARVHRGV